MNTMIDASLAHLVAEARRFPLLSPTREHELVMAWRETNDRVALQQLLGSHLRLVVKIARGFAGYGLPLAELVAEGNVGLMEAVEKFAPDRGFRFATYATWRVRAAIQEYVLHNWSLVKIGTTAAQKKLFFNLRRLKTRLEIFAQGDLSPQNVTSIAQDLAVPESDVVEMNRRLSGRDNSLNAMAGADSDDDWLALLQDERPSQEATIGEFEEGRRRHDMLVAALDKLNPRERAVVVARRLKEDPASLEDLSQRYAVSRERIWKIESLAVEKVRHAILATERDTRSASRLIAASRARMSQTGRANP